MIYRTGETPRVGDRVSHYVDGDEGDVVAILADGVCVKWERDGEQDHLADECGLIERGAIA